MTQGSPKQAKPAQKPEQVTIRVLPLGDGKIATGKDELLGSGVVFGRAKKGDRLEVAPEVGEALEAKGLAEIV